MIVMTIRLNELYLQLVEIHQAYVGNPLPLPSFDESVAAGFPSPAGDYVEKQLDLNDLIVKHPAATFFVRVEGESMKGAGISSGDILAVDRSLEPANGKIVVAVLNGEFTVKRIQITQNGVFLVPENPAFPPISVSEATDFQVWGVVTYVIHKAR